MRRTNETTRRTRALAAAAVASAMVLACFATVGCGQQEEITEEAALVRVDAPGWDAEGSTPVILIVTEAGDAEASFARAISANSDEEMELAPGDYQVEVLSPVNADGSAYEEIDALEVAVPPENEGDYALCVTLSPIPAADMSKERMSAVLDGYARAVAAGDETLAGDAGRAVIEKAALNAAACPAMSKEAIEELASAAEEAVSENPVAKPSAGAPSDSSSSGSSASTTPATPPAASDTSSNAGSSGSTGGSVAPSQPSHEHSWSAVTYQKWVVDQAAWDEDIYKTNIVCTCGKIWPSTAAWDDHCKASVLAGGSGCRHQSKPVYVETIHHDEVGHYETVTTGYSCSCGATK